MIAQVCVAPAPWPPRRGAPLAAAWRPRRSRQTPWQVADLRSSKRRPRRTRGRSPSARRPASAWWLRPCRLRSTTRTPLAITSLPLGTVIRMSNDALSRGWSLAGNHQVAMCGSFMVTTSVSLASQLLSPCEISRPGRRRTAPRRGTAVPSATGLAGVIRSSWSPVCSDVAAPPVDGHRPDRQQEVEVEAGQVLRGPDVEPGPAGEPPGAERVAVVDVVVQHVDAAVAVVREVRVADPRRARRPGPARAAAGAATQRRCRPAPAPSRAREEHGTEDEPGLRHGQAPRRRRRPT